MAEIADGKCIYERCERVRREVEHVSRLPTAEGVTARVNELAKQAASIS